jgi:glycolate oxidase FAD binding subunit
MTQSSISVAGALQSILGSSRISAEPTTLAAYAIHRLTPVAAAKPASVEQAAEVVRFAVSEKLAVVACGARTKLTMGAPPARYDIALDMSGFRQIAHYDPADLTLSVDAGLSIDALNATLLRHKQFVPLFTPYYFASTAGGAIASGLDSPLRQGYGTARDFLLGAEFIDGRGALVKSGGRVVKNVTGYDLHKLLIGSLGTLAVITRLNFRTFPAPIAGSHGFVASFPTHQAALTLRRRIVDSHLSPLTLDVLNPTAAGLFATRTPLMPEPSIFTNDNSGVPRTIDLALPGEWFRRDQWQVCAAFAGAPEVLERCQRDLTRFANTANASSVSVLDDTTRPSVWGRLREALPLFRESSPSATTLRLNVLPGYHAKAITVLEAVSRTTELPFALVARAAGPLYVALLPESVDDEARPNNKDDKLAFLVGEAFAFARSCHGEATLLFAPPTFQGRLPAPAPSGLALMHRLKAAFDPHNVFAPDRLHPAI